MKILKRISKGIIALSLALAFMIPTNLGSILAVEAASTAPKLEDESFIPTRTYIPYFLANYSSYDSELVKSLWEKVFYEESVKGTAWIDKYGSVNNYASLDGTLKNANSYLDADSRGGKITYSTGDFEAFFGNTLEANPEFFGELLGLDGYIGTTKMKKDSLAAHQDVLRTTLCNYLKDPNRYSTYFVPSIVNLTKNYHGLLTNPTLTSTTVGGIRMDYYLLITLASQYKKTDEQGNSVLDSTQTDWIEGKAYEFYVAYTTGNNATLKWIVQSYPSIYDMVARSRYAANESNTTYKSEFFNYVINSGVGAGRWLNLNYGINIPGLDDFDNIPLMFEASHGYCGGHAGGVGAHTNATFYSYCTGQFNPTEHCAYFLGMNGVAQEYFKLNGSVWTAYNNWYKTYRIKHSPGNGEIEYYNTTVEGLVLTATSTTNDGASQYRIAKKDTHSLEHGDGLIGGNSEITGTISAYVSKAPTNAEKIVVDFSINDGITNGGGAYDKTEVTNIQYLVNGVDQGVSYTYITNDDHYKSIAFDISGKDYNSRVNGIIVISCWGMQHSEANGYHASCTSRANITIPSLSYTAKCKRPQCEIYGHSLVGSAIFSSDKKTATIAYYCQNDVSPGHYFNTEKVNTVRTIEGDEYVYTATASALYNPATNEKFQYQTRVPIGGASAGSTSKTVTLNRSNTTSTSYNNAGQVYNTASSTTTWYADGSKSQAKYNRIWKSCDTTIEYTINAGIIKPGTKSVTVNLDYVRNLESFDFKIINSRGQVIGQSSYSKTAHDGTKAITIMLTKTDVNEVKDCYVSASIRTSTTNYASDDYAEPDNATTWVLVKSITMNYN